MIFTKPTSFAEAVKYLKDKALLPTFLNSAQLKELEDSIRSQSFFSAQTMYEDVLAGYQGMIGKILEPTLVFRDVRDVATGFSFSDARLQIKDMLDALGYEPEKPGIEDLSSDARINLVLQTNLDIASGFGFWKQGQDPLILDEWPASELYRAENRKEPRDWPERWQQAGESSGQEGWGFFDERMIALKNHPIWDLLGKLFADGLSNPFPPFAFNSGMDVRDVDREEAMSLGLIDRDTLIMPDSRSLEQPEEAVA